MGTWRSEWRQTDMLKFVMKAVLGSSTSKKISWEVFALFRALEVMTVWAKRDVTVQSTVTLYTSTWDRKTERWISVRSCYFISDWSVFCSWVLSIVCCPAWLVPKKTVTSWKNVEKDIMSVPPLWECCDETDWVSAWVLYTGIVWEFENYTLLQSLQLC